jgi:hypothetical protein
MRRRGGRFQRAAELRLARAAPAARWPAQYVRKLPNDADRWTHRDDATPSKNNQIDYLLVSEALWPRLREVGIERRGIWASAKKTRAKYPPLDSVTGDSNSASDHAAVWADFDF